MNYREFCIKTEIGYDPQNQEDLDNLQKLWDLYLEFDDRLNQLKKEFPLSSTIYSSPVKKEDLK